MGDRLPLTLEDWERAHWVTGVHRDMGRREGGSNYYRSVGPDFEWMARAADAALAWLDKLLGE